MPRYTVTVDARVELVYEIEASSTKEARALTLETFGVSGKIFGLPDAAYAVLEDSVTEVFSMEVVPPT